ncbi:hypothetical protein N658DRAFT_13044 [Parathielavia hyrcaniae]|uniref:Uncharacterized protein n=1 Tax=Parathielavia hyrcaniae TaxID=113614 RepID=A0AAN6QF24_9PEZI|nr:hypothetical protein N658DRAFT_13044 [Parathielavia hyrcaniae]
MSMQLPTGRSVMFARHRHTGFVCCPLPIARCPVPGCRVLAPGVTPPRWWRAGIHCHSEKSSTTDLYHLAMGAASLHVSQDQEGLSLQRRREHEEAAQYHLSQRWDRVVRLPHLMRLKSCPGVMTRGCTYQADRCRHRLRGLCAPRTPQRRSRLACFLHLEQAPAPGK